MLKNIFDMNINIILKIIHVLLAIWNKHTLDSMRKKKASNTPGKVY